MTATGQMPKPFVVMVTDRRRSRPGGLVEAVGRASRAGVDAIQLRERGLEDGDLLVLAREVTRVAAAAGARTLVNDRTDVALAAGADGVHLPARAVSCARVRPVAPPGFLIGRSVHTCDEARMAEDEGGCDYLLFGSVFATESKPDTHQPAGLDPLARVCAAVTLPVLAIGGITVDRVDEVARTGAAGIAGIGLFAGGQEAELVESVRRIRAAFRVSSRQDG
jgi:thiamine-phosphate pyrophosphorylase